MRDFDYVVPQSLDEAVARGRQADHRFIAGGTLLVDLLRLDVERPAALVDLNSVLSARIDWAPNGLTVGALAKNSDLADHPSVRRELPALSEALESGASPQVRNMASLGGNLMQRTRCSYFRDPGVPECNKRTPGSGCAALEGYSRMHAVLGGSHACIAVHPSDMCVALLALDAVVRTRRSQGGRAIPIGDFHTLPGDTPEIETALEPGEVVTEVFVPATGFGRRSAYVKVRDRASFAFALASAAVALELAGEEIASARVALGGVATKPWRALEVEAALLGRAPSRETFEAASRFATNGAEPTPHNQFKVELVRRVVVRALERAAAA